MGFNHELNVMLEQRFADRLKQPCRLISYEPPNKQSVEAFIETFSKLESPSNFEINRLLVIVNKSPHTDKSIAKKALREVKNKISNDKRVFLGKLVKRYCYPFYFTYEYIEKRFDIHDGEEIAHPLTMSIGLIFALFFIFTVFFGSIYNELSSAGIEILAYSFIFSLFFGGIYARLKTVPEFKNMKLNVNAQNNLY